MATNRTANPCRNCMLWLCACARVRVHTHTHHTSTLPSYGGAVSLWMIFHGPWVWHQWRIECSVDISTAHRWMCYLWAGDENWALLHTQRADPAAPEMYIMRTFLLFVCVSSIQAYSTITTGSCDFQLDENSFELSRVAGACPSAGGVLSLTSKGIKSLAPGVFHDLPAVTWVSTCETESVWVCAWCVKMNLCMHTLLHCEIMYIAALWNNGVCVVSVFTE